MTDNAVQRLFFALWPDRQTAGSLARVCADLVGDQGRRLAAPQLHLTLAYMGAASDAQQACYCRSADAVLGHSFRLEIDLCGHFPRPQVVWLGPSRVPVALSELHLALVSELSRRCNYVPEARPFAPHITVQRKVRRFREPDAVALTSWEVSEFVLASSRTLATGAEYTVLQRWPLQAAQS